jgi:hypothetical protein
LGDAAAGDCGQGVSESVPGTVSIPPKTRIRARFRQVALAAPPTHDRAAEQGRMLTQVPVEVGAEA